MSQLSPRLTAYLQSWFNTSTQKQAGQGVTVELSWAEFLDLFEERQLASLQKAIDRNSLRDQQGETNRHAYVVTWRSYAARSTNLFNRDTACVCSRQKSAALSLPKAGDFLRQSHCDAISAALTGRMLSMEVREKISQSTKGQPKAGWSPERKAARSRQRQEQEATKRGEGGK